MSSEKRNGTPPAFFRAGSLEPALVERQRPEESLGLVARRMAGRYAMLMRRELATLTFHEYEASLICDALNGVWLMDDGEMGERGIALAWAEVAEHVSLNRADVAHGLTPGRAADLVERLRAMSPGQQHAMVDAVERFWRDPNRLPTGELLRDVGLVR